MDLLTGVTVVIMDQLSLLPVLLLIRRQLSCTYLRVAACDCLFALGINWHGLQKCLGENTCSRGNSSANRALAVGELLTSHNQMRSYN